MEGVQLSHRMEIYGPATPIGCLSSTEGVFTLADLQLYLNEESNTLSLNRQGAFLFLLQLN
jgi:hypothetical protein